LREQEDKTTSGFRIFKKGPCQKSLAKKKKKRDPNPSVRQRKAKTSPKNHPMAPSRRCKAGLQFRDNHANPGRENI